MRSLPSLPSSHSLGLPCAHIIVLLTATHSHIEVTRNLRQVPRSAGARLIPQGHGGVESRTSRLSGDSHRRARSTKASRDNRPLMHSVQAPTTGKGQKRGGLIPPTSPPVGLSLNVSSMECRTDQHFQGLLTVAVKNSALRQRRACSPPARCSSGRAWATVASVDQQSCQSLETNSPKFESLNAIA